MVTKQLNEYLNTNNLLNKHQYGFQSYKSTFHALLLTYLLQVNTDDNFSFDTRIF